MEHCTQWKQNIPLIVYCIFVSEIYEVLDVTFKDIGTSSDYGTWTNTDFTGDTLKRNEEYTTLTPQTTFVSAYLNIGVADCCIEFDMNLSNISNAQFLRFTKNKWNYTCQISNNFLEINTGQWHHIKLAKSGNNLRIFVDNIEKTPQTLSDTTDGFRLVLSNAQVTDMKYKNFVVYPI